MTEEKGITFYQLSKETGIAQSNFSRWKSGEGEPSLQSLLKIAEYFQCDLQELLRP